MNNKQFKKYIDKTADTIDIKECGELLACFLLDDCSDEVDKVVNRLNEQYDLIQELKNDNRMLKTTIGRNESYINRLKNTSVWSNHSEPVVNKQEKYYNNLKITENGFIKISGKLDEYYSPLALMNELNEQQETIDEQDNRIKLLEGQLDTYNEGCYEIYKDNQRLEKELEQVKKDREDIFICERDTKNELREFKQKVKKTLEKHYQENNECTEVQKIIQSVIEVIAKEVGIYKDEHSCMYCKFFHPIISQGGAYKCYKKDLFMDYSLYEDCEDFELDTEESLTEKEKKTWD